MTMISAPVVPEFVNGIRQAVREAKRHALQSAMHGTARDRWDYALARATMPATERLMIFGTCTVDTAAVLKRADHWFRRLERMAAR